MPKPQLKSKQKQRQHQNKKKINKTSVQKDFDKFRHEIYKLGLSTFDKKDQLDARVELAIKLGARAKSWAKPNKNLSKDNREASTTSSSSTTDSKLKQTTSTHHGKAR